MSTITGRIPLEGIYLCALIPLIERKIKGAVCTSVGMTSSSTMALRFREGWLQLDANPGQPGLWFSQAASPADADSPSWEHHIRGAAVERVTQQGADRVLEITFSEKTPYQRGGATLIFEAAGRNANIILVRRNDGRILAALRKVLSSVNRFRTVSPGAVYRKPPSSGYPPSEWGTARVQEILGGKVTPKVLYGTLEGVGPGTAKAILAADGKPADTVARIGAKICSGEFEPWETSYGPMPCRLGQGRTISSPLEPPKEKEKGSGDSEYRPSFRELETLLARRIGKERKRAESAEVSLSKLRSPDELRMLGNLILTRKNELKKGMSEAVLLNWDGTRVTAALKVALTPVQNAEKYFRKAGRIHLEKERLEAVVEKAVDRIEELRQRMETLGELSEGEAADLLQTLKKPERKVTGGPLEFLLEGGWRCLAGRNARQNDRLTFRVAGRDDIWLHARGAAGAHVIIRRDGRADNPGKPAMEQAARIAADHSSSNGVVPVDWTLIKYVRRMKGGGPGQVVYTREKTIFAEV